MFYHPNQRLSFGQPPASLAWESRNTNAEWCKVPPKFAGSVAAGPRMNRLKDAIGQPWMNHYKLSERERRVCRSFPAVLVGRGLGLLVPDS